MKELNSDSYSSFLTGPKGYLDYQCFRVLENYSSSKLMVQRSLFKDKGDHPFVLEIPSVPVQEQESPGREELRVSFYHCLFRPTTAVRMSISLLFYAQFAPAEQLKG